MKYHFVDKQYFIICLKQDIVCKQCDISNTKCFIFNQQRMNVCKQNLISFKKIVAVGLNCFRLNQQTSFTGKKSAISCGQTIVTDKQPGFFFTNGGYLNQLQPGSRFFKLNLLLNGLLYLLLFGRAFLLYDHLKMKMK